MNLKITDLYDLNHTRAAEYLAGFTYPWEALAGISELIRALGAQLPEDEFDRIGEDVWIAKDATVFATAYIHGPCIIGHRTEVRQCAFIRGSALVGDNGRVLLRKSGTEPVLRVMAEADTFEACEENVNAIIDAMAASKHLIEVKK